MDTKLTLKSTIIAGIFMALWSVLPFISYYNLFCGMWIILGGIISVFIYKRATEEEISIVEGGMLGVISGLIGAVIFVLVSFTGFMAITALSNVIREASLGLAFYGLFGSIIAIVLFILLGAVGGCLGGVMFGKENLKNEYNYDIDYIKKLKKDR